MAVYSFTRIGKTKYNQLNILNNRNVLSQFWRPEVQDQGTSRVDSFRGL